MPSSDTSSIPYNINIVQLIRPESIIDIGFGWGKYAYLCREYLSDHDGFFGKKKIRMDGVEGYQKNVEKIHYDIYDNIFITDANLVDEYLNFDYNLALILDVFEHIEKIEGKLLLKRLLEKCDYVLINIPRYATVQEGYDDDPSKYEKHRSFWTKSELKKLGNCIIIPNKVNKTIALFKKDNDSFSPELKKYCTRQIINKLVPYIVIDVYNYLRWFLLRNNRKYYIAKS